jgi:hypothetical protein
VKPDEAPVDDVQLLLASMPLAISKHQSGSVVTHSIPYLFFLAFVGSRLSPNKLKEIVNKYTALH